MFESHLVLKLQTCLHMDDGIYCSSISMDFCATISNMVQHLKYLVFKFFLYCSIYLESKYNMVYIEKNHISVTPRGHANSCWLHVGN